MENYMNKIYMAEDTEEIRDIILEADYDDNLTDAEYEEIEAYGKEKMSDIETEEDYYWNAKEDEAVERFYGVE